MYSGTVTLYGGPPSWSLVCIKKVWICENKLDLCKMLECKHKEVCEDRQTGNISVMSSPFGLSRSFIFMAQADLMSGSMAQKNLKKSSYGQM